MLLYIIYYATLYFGSVIWFMLWKKIRQAKQFIKQITGRYQRIDKRGIGSFTNICCKETTSKTN